MDTRSDQQLLADYAERHVEAAFAELVRRHIDLVHSAAWRMVGDSALAQDVTQGAFIALARSAAQLRDRSVLSGWLHGTARNLAANAVRSDVRRRAREQEAAAMNELISADPGPSWEQVSPHLDAALGQLSELDRDAVLLRYFEKKSAQEIGQIMGVSAEAAQKRVSRAVDRLREYLARHGIAAGAAGLVAVISTYGVQAAPAGLAATVYTAATLAGSLGPALTATATGTATATAAAKAIAMTTLQKTIITATVAVLAGGGIYEARQAAHLRDQVTALSQQQEPLTEQIRQLQRERDEATNRLATMTTTSNPAPDQTAELLRLRGMAGVARRATSEAEQLRAQLTQQAAAATNNLVTGAMAEAMSQSMERQFESRLARMTALLHLTPEQVSAAREILLRQARAMSAGMQQAMTGKYDKSELTRLAESAGNPDQKIKALLTPEQQAAYPAYQQDEAAHTASLAANQELLQLQATLNMTAEQQDRAYAALYEVSLSQMTGGAKQPFTGTGDAMQNALEQKARALEPILNETQMEAYRQQQALQAKLIKDVINKMENSNAAK